MLREMTDPAEVERLLPCLLALSAHHNAVSTYFNGAFPSRPYDATLNAFASALRTGHSRIAVVEKDWKIAGFCKTDLQKDEDYGKLDYLIILDAYRGMGSAVC